MKRLTGVVNSFNIDLMKRRSKKLIGPKTNVRKHSDPLPLIKNAARKDTLFIKTHAFDEMAEDNITPMELRQALINGKRNPAKDLLLGLNWRYAIEGWTDAGDRKLRVPCAISDEDDVIVVTAMEIMKVGNRP